MGIYLELTWISLGAAPGAGAGGEGEAGPDLDLHFLHPFAEGAMRDCYGDGVPDPYFDPVFDCSRFNPQPDWGGRTTHR